jgi:hypothetical protein
MKVCASSYNSNPMRLSVFHEGPCSICHDLALRNNRSSGRINGTKSPAAAYGFGRGVASPSVNPIAHFTASVHICWMSGRSQMSSRWPSEE